MWILLRFAIALQKSSDSNSESLMFEWGLGTEGQGWGLGLEAKATKFGFKAKD